MNDFATSIDRLHRHVRHWEQARWSDPAGRGTRADLMYALVQRLAQYAADAEHLPCRPVPREADVVLPDQLRVVSDDLVVADPPAGVLTEATAAVDELRRML